MSEKALRKSIKNINFDLIANDICDPSIVYNKFMSQYELCKRFLIGISNLYNSYPKTPFKNYVLDFKKELYEYKDYVEFLKKITVLSNDMIDELSITFKTFNKGPLIAYMMHSYRLLMKYDMTDNEWIIKSRHVINPFKDCGISVSELFHSNKTIAIENFRKIQASLNEFYSVFTKPNFNLAVAIDRMCDYLEQIHRRGEVKCDLVPGYIKKVHRANILDIEAMNLAYLETENKGVFVTELMNSLLNVDSSDIKPNAKTHMQIKRLFVYIGQKNNDPRLSSTLSAAKDLIGLSEKEMEKK